MERACLWMANRYSRPVEITETGFADKDVPSREKAVHDPARIAWLNKALSEIRSAQLKGADIVSVHVWSLIDNWVAVRFPEAPGAWLDRFHEPRSTRPEGFGALVLQPRENPQACRLIRSCHKARPQIVSRSSRAPVRGPLRVRSSWLRTITSSRRTTICVYAAPPSIGIAQVRQNEGLPECPNGYASEQGSHSIGIGSDARQLPAAGNEEMVRRLRRLTRTACRTHGRSRFTCGKPRDTGQSRSLA